MRFAVAAVAVALVVAVAGGCGDRRRPIVVRGDLGPAVVVVDPRKVPPAPKLPLIDEKEPDDDREHAQPIEPGKGVKGTLGPPRTVKGKQVPDEDIFVYTHNGEPTDGGFDEARIEVTGVAGVDLVLEALDGEGKRLWQANDGGDGAGEVIPNLAVTPGQTFYVRVRPTKPVPTPPGESYALTVVAGPAPPGEEREPNDDEKTANVLSRVSDASGFFGRRRDEDWLALPGPEAAGAGGGAMLRVELASVEGVAPSVRVVAGGATVAEARGGRGEELRLRNVGVPPEAKSVFVVVRAAEGKSSDLRWTLRLGYEGVLEGAEREPNDTAAKATALVVPPGGGVQMAGFLWAGDADVYKISGAPEGALVEVALEPAPRVDWKLERISLDGKVVAKADDAGVGQGEALPPTVMPPGGLFVRVSGRARDVAFDAPYTIAVTSGGAAATDAEHEPNDRPEQATAIPPGSTVMRGWLAPKGDVDVWKVVAPEGKARLSVEVTPPSGIDAQARLTDENKAPLGPAESGGRASGPVAAGKTYFVTVKASSEKASKPREPYSLTLRWD
jgi:hypothetical protein